MVTLKAGDHEFLVHKNVLTRDSAYFAKCLGDPAAFIEAQTSTVTFDDIGFKELGIYINLAYRQALLAGEDIKIPRCRIKALVKTYQLSDRFLNKGLCTAVQRALSEIFQHSPPCRAPPVQAAQDLSVWIVDYAEGYEALDPEDTNQKNLRSQLLESFCDHFPLDKYRKYSDAISKHHQFVFDLSRRFSDLLCTCHKETTAQKTYKLAVEDSTLQDSANFPEW